MGAFTDLAAAVSDADLVIEAVPEVLEIGSRASRAWRRRRRSSPRL
ncbi:hypothetical protein, partial [Amycolatopsis sp. M39]